MAAEVVGREAELEALDAFLDVSEQVPRALRFQGEPGIEKTILWRAGVDRANERDCRILLARPTESETALPFAGLADLLDATFVDGIADELPEPQRLALDTALQRRASTDGPPEQLALDRAVLVCLRTLASDRPLVVAIDDVQWLDAPTGRVLTFALRRLETESVRLLFSQRAGEESPLDLDRSVIGSSLQHVDLGALSVDALDELLATRLALQLSRPRLRELHRLTGGNPFFALEIGRALRAAPGELRVPPTLRDALGVRIAALSEPAREVLVLFAAGSALTVADVAALATQDAFTECVEAGVLVIDGAEVRFSHPLLASIAYDTASEQMRRTAHQRLAAASVGRQERALHLALASDPPDERLAAELEAASEEAWARGAPELAATLLEHAVRLTPTEHDEDVVRRMTLHAEHLQTAGDLRRAYDAFAALCARLGAGLQRARALARLANLEPDSDIHARHLRQALDEAGGDLSLAAGIHVTLHYLALGNGDLDAARAHGAEAARLADLHGDRRLRAVGLTALGYAKCMLDEDGFDELELALELEKTPPNRDSVYYPRTYSAALTMGLALVHAAELDRGRVLILQELERATATGQEMYRARIINELAFLELRAGDWISAVRYAREGVALARQSSSERVLLSHQCTAALVDAHLGLCDEAAAVAEEVVASAGRVHDPYLAGRGRAVLGFIELSRGDFAAADAKLAPTVDAFREAGSRRLLRFPGLENEIEALVALGELERAGELIGLVERAPPASLGRSWSDAVAARGRALLLAAQGDAGRARDSIERALAAHEQLPDPFELGRTLLVQGTIERRAKRKRLARDSLVAALDVFDGLGAALWAEKAAGELARVGGRRPSGATLTPSELRVAELVAEGLSNKEVAAALFVTPHTVEGHLTHIYEKLGVHSRTELTRRLLARAQEV